MELGKNIRELRKNRKITQAELGKKIGVDQKVITSYERGICNPPIERLVKISKVFDVSLDELVGIKKMSTKVNGKNQPHKNKRSVKAQEFFDKLPVAQQRALLSMFKAAANS